MSYIILEYVVCVFIAAGVATLGFACALVVMLAKFTNPIQIGWLPPFVQTRHSVASDAHGPRRIIHGTTWK